MKTEQVKHDAVTVALGKSLATLAVMGTVALAGAAGGPLVAAGVAGVWAWLLF